MAIGPGGLLLRELKMRTGRLSPEQRRYAQVIGDRRTGAMRQFDIWRDPADRLSGRIALELAAVAV